LREAHQNNVHAVVATPHMFLEPFNLRDPEVVRTHFQELLKTVARVAEQPTWEFLNEMELHLGAENYACPDFLTALARNQGLTLGQGLYLLVEFPPLISLNQIWTVVDHIQNSSLVPVLAHVERYRVLAKKPMELQKFLERGCLTQVNLGSLLRPRWSSQGRLVRKLVTEELISIIASDSHGTRFRPPRFEELKKFPAGLNEDRILRWCVQFPNWVLQEKQQR